MQHAESGPAVRAPEFPEGITWINSVPLTMTELRGKVVLIDIWDYTCVNCLRALPYLQEWHRRYRPSGLVVVGVHTPEFEFAESVENVSAAVKQYGISYPILLDNDYAVWEAYANQYWPREYLVDSRGYVVYDHAGEGGYYRTELMIQRLLSQLNPRVRFEEPYVQPGPVESGGLCYPVSPEIYLGYERGRLGSREGYERESVVTYRDEGEYKDGYAYVNGPWLNLPESLRHARVDKLFEDYIGVKYHALSVNAVIGPGEEKVYRVYVRQDGANVEEQNAGEDLRIERDGRSYVEVTDPRMYRIIRNSEFGLHTLKLYSESESFDLYSLTFGSCEVERE